MSYALNLFVFFLFSFHLVQGMEAQTEKNQQILDVSLNSLAHIIRESSKKLSVSDSYLPLKDTTKVIVEQEYQKIGEILGKDGGRYTSNLRSSWRNLAKAFFELILQKHHQQQYKMKRDYEKVSRKLALLEDELERTPLMNYFQFFSLVDRALIYHPLSSKRDLLSKKELNFNTGFVDYAKTRNAALFEDPTYEQWMLIDQHHSSFVHRNYLSVFALISAKTGPFPFFYPFSLDVKDLNRYCPFLNSQSTLWPVGFILEKVVADGETFPPDIYAIHDLQHLGLFKNSFSISHIEILRDDFSNNWELQDYLTKFYIKDMEMRYGLLLSYFSHLLQFLDKTRKDLEEKKQKILEDKITFLNFLIFYFWHEGFNNIVSRLYNSYDGRMLNYLLTPLLIDKEYYLENLPKNICQYVLEELEKKTSKESIFEEVHKMMLELLEGEEMDGVKQRLNRNSKALEMALTVPLNLKIKLRSTFPKWPGRMFHPYLPHNIYGKDTSEKQNDRDFVQVLDPKFLSGYSQTYGKIMEILDMDKKTNEINLSFFFEIPHWGKKIDGGQLFELKTKHICIYLPSQHDYQDLRPFYLTPAGGMDLETAQEIHEKNKAARKNAKKSHGYMQQKDQK